jgi:cell wall assembly regulator SMI1
MTEIREIWQRLESWFQDYAPEVASDWNPGATEAQLVQLEEWLGCRLPEDFRESYKIHDGQKDDTVGLAFGMALQPLDWSLSRMKEFVDFGKDDPAWLTNVNSMPAEAVQRFRAHRSWVPVTQDSGGNYMGLDMAPGPKGQAGQVIIFGSREETNYVVAPNWRAFLEHLLHLMEQANVTLGERDEIGMREMEPLNPLASHFHEYVADLYKREGAAQDRPPRIDELTSGTVPDSRHAFSPDEEEEIRRWATGLELFRLYRPDSGYSFLVSFRCSTEQELSETQQSLEAALQGLKLAEDSARFESVGGVLSLLLSGAEGESWKVTEADYEQARRVEQLLQPYRERILQPPRASSMCVSPEYYPQLWGLAARLPIRKR